MSVVPLLRRRCGGIQTIGVCCWAFYSSMLGRGVKMAEKPMKEAMGARMTLVDGARPHGHVQDVPRPHKRGRELRRGLALSFSADGEPQSKRKATVRERRS